MIVYKNKKKLPEEDIKNKYFKKFCDKYVLENIWLIEGLDHLDSGEFPHVFMLQQKKKKSRTLLKKIMNSVTKLNLFDARI